MRAVLQLVIVIVAQNERSADAEESFDLAQRGVESHVEFGSQRGLVREFQQSGGAAFAVALCGFPFAQPRSEVAQRERHHKEHQAHHRVVRLTNIKGQ